MSASIWRLVLLGAVFQFSQCNSEPFLEGSRLRKIQTSTGVSNILFLEAI